MPDMGSRDKDYPGVPMMQCLESYSTGQNTLQSLEERRKKRGQSLGDLIKGPQIQTRSTIGGIRATRVSTVGA